MNQVRLKPPARAHLLLAALAILFFLWMISPAFTAMYIEVYVARLQAMAILLHRHLSLALADQVYPINTEFLYLTRLGMVEIIRFGITLFGAASIWAVRAPNLLSFALFAVAGILFARRWSAPASSLPTSAPESPWLLAAIFVLTPGILEPAFFLADNLPSAALTTLALALVTARVSAPRWIAIGALMAAATLIRLDAVLVAPMLLVVLWFATRDLRRSAIALAFGLLGAALIFALSTWATGVSPLLSLAVGRSFSAANSAAIYDAGLKRTLFTTIGFFGLITGVCLPLGLWHNLRRAPRAWSLVFGLMPALFYLAFLPKANETRDFLLLAAPFVLLHGATGLRLLLDAARQPRNLSQTLPRGLARLALLFFFVVLFAPPVLLLKDGPRAYIGRAYAPVFWRQWQARTTSANRDLTAWVDTLHPGDRVLVVQSYFEPDRYLNLVLLQQGFALQPLGPHPCGSSETYTKNGITVVNIRTEDPYGLVSDGMMDKQMAAMQFLSTLDCLRPTPFTKAIHLSWGFHGFEYWKAAGILERIPQPSFPFKVLHGVDIPRLRITPWSASDLDRAAATARIALAEQNAITRTHPPVPSYPEYHRRMLNHLWHPAGTPQ